MTVPATSRAAPASPPRRLAGLYAPITTPFEPSGELAGRRHTQNVAQLCAAGLDGLLVAGSTGEAPLLDPDEQRALVAISAAALPAGKALVVGTGAEATRQAIALSRAAGNEGAHAVVVRPPAYFGAVSPPAAIVAYFRAVADASPVPVFVYNMPKFTHVSIAPALIEELSDHPNIIGVKDSSGDAQNLAAYRKAAPRWIVLAGSASLLLTCLELGCDGAIAAVACFAPQRCADVIAAFRAGDRARAATLQDALRPLDREIVGRLGPAGVKAAMDAAGLYGGPVRAPLVDVSAADREHIASLLAA
jgi:4-hydroxy-2-oxoglutarate aldolase